jgi:CubicO group peptidase (beta-lactamase class C family)
MKYEKNCQLCVYVKDECVIDVCMSNPDKKTKIKVDGDSVGTIYSSGKSVAAILIAIMVDQGRLNYNDPVSKYWPEFG